MATSIPDLVDVSKSESQAGGVPWGHLDLPEGALFGTDGIRGKAGDLLTAVLAMRVGYWAGQVLREVSGDHAPIVVGRDSRNSSDMLATALSSGLTSAGLDVWDLGMCPTPVVAHVASTTGAIGGVMISASHNPPGDNGIKFFSAQGSKLEPTLQKRIEQAIRGDIHIESTHGENVWGQHIYRPELLEGYLKDLTVPLIQESATPFLGLKIVLDLAWGAATRTAVGVFESLGAKVIPLHEEPNGDRINVNCGSTHLESLKEAVQLHDADFGVAFDGDADRSLFVDGQGRTVDGDYILYFWGKQLLERGQLPDETIVSTVMSNLGFERAWEKLGGQLIRAAVGDQYVHAEMVKTGAALGGEQSGHILCPRFGISGDGLMTALHMADLVKQSGGNLSALVDRSFQTYPQILKNVRVEDRNTRLNWQTCEPVMAAIEEAEKSMGDKGRILVRASGTEPVIRVMVEAETMELVTEWTDKLVNLVELHLTTSDQPGPK
jgi:phosphoglucosamine mutase